MDKDAQKMADTALRPNAKTVMELDKLTKTNLDRLLQRREMFIEYLLSKADECDWHGVADAAMDLREIEVAIAYERPTDT